MKRIPIPTVLVALLLVAILLFYLFTFQVDYSQRAVRIRFGRASAQVIDQPGLYFKVPLVEQIKPFDTRLRVLDTPETELKTQDGQNLIIGCYAIWRVKEPLLFNERVPNDREAEEKIRTRLNEARATVVGRHSMSDFVNLDSELVHKSHDAIYDEMRDNAAPALLKDYGVELARVGIRRISVPEETTAAIQQSMIAERDALATRYREEGKSIAQTIKSSAESAKSSILAFVAAKAEEIESAGTQASERVFEQIKGDDSEFFIWLRYLEAIEAALKTRTTFFINAQSDIFRVFNTPGVTSPKPAPPVGAPAGTRAGE